MNLSINNHNIQPIDFICGITPFDRLTEAECKRVEQTVESSQFTLGTHILEQDGAPSKYLYIIFSGAVRFVKDGQVVRVLVKDLHQATLWKAISLKFLMWTN
jgi:signal-transduction protein with cAMP-binding, CBS, and nucleotidyltransferase domain